MNAKSLIPLILLAAVGGVLAWQGNTIAPYLGLRNAGTGAAVSSSASAKALADKLAPEKIRKLELTVNGETTSLEQKGGEWTQPGNWPVVQSEAAKLIDAITTLRTRYVPIPFDNAESTDFKPYGLDASQKPITVKADLGGETMTLMFGQPPLEADVAPFARPTYCRIDSLNEIVRLSPEVYGRLAKPGDYFRRRQLVPDADRVKLSGGEPAPNPMNPTPPPAVGRVALVTDAIQTIRVESKEGSYTLKRTAPMPQPKPDPDRPTGEPVVTANRLATVWELVEPVRDHVDPAKLRAVLTAIPELWAEAFLPNKTLAEAGLDKPERSIVITKANGQSITLRLGKESRTVQKMEGPPPSPFNPRPPQPQISVEVYGFAKLDDNPQLFEIRTDKLNDLFTKLDELRDASLARFETADATEVTVTVKGQPPIKLVKRKGNKDADKEEDKQDRWYVGEGPNALLAEATKITELLDALNKLEARNPPAPLPGLPPEKTDPAIIDSADAKKLADLGIDPNAGTKVTVVAQPRVAEGDAPIPPRTFTFLIGKHDADKKKLNVQLAGWPRVNVVDDAVVKLIDRPALAYRGRRLFDTAVAKLTDITVGKGGAESFALKQDAAPSTTWKLTKPVASDADEVKATQIAGDLSRLEAVEFVNDAPKPEELAKYGLDKPRLTADLGFTGAGAKPAKLEIGAIREGKPESYARLNGGGSVFAIANSTIENLEKGAVGLMPLQLWQATSDKITGIDIRRSADHGNESYKLSLTGTDWKLSGPFDAPAGFGSVQGLLTATANMKAERCDALAPDLAKHGFDKPALRVVVTIKETKPAKDGQPAKDEFVTKSIVVGNVADGGPNRFATLEGGPSQAVYVIADPLLKEADKPALDLLDKQVLSLDPALVSKIQIVTDKADESIALTKDDKAVWKADGQTFAIDKPSADALVRNVAQPNIARFAGYGVGVKWADYGLDKPEKTVTVTITPPAGDANAKPETHTIKLGRVDTTGERFARINDGPGLLILNTRTADALAKAKLDFVDRTFLTFDPTTLNGIARKKGADELELTQTATGGWELTKPVKLKADSPTLDDLADQLSKLRAVKVAAFGAKELKPFGLDAPAGVVNLNVGLEKPETKTLKIGNPVDSSKPAGDRYAMVDGKGDVTVGILAAATANKLLADPLKFRDRSLAKFVDADRITIARGERKVTFAKIEGTWKMTQPTTADAEQADLDELVNAFARLRADELIAEKPADLKPYGLDKPDTTLAFFAGEKEVLSLVVGKKEDNGPRRFAKLAAGDLVTLLDDKLTGRATAEYRKRAAWQGVDAAQIETVAISSGANSFALRKDGTNWVDPAKPDEAFDAAKVTELLDALAGLKAERYAADQNADLKLYGLEPPERVIVVTQRGLVKTLHLGRAEGGSDGKRVYARVVEPGRTDVFVLSDADTAKLTRERAAFRK
jgi:hypothetical protein